MAREFDKQITRQWNLPREPLNDVLLILLNHDIYHLWDRENVIKNIQAEIRERMKGS